MIINGRTVFVYDIESFHNLFICNVINSESKKTKTIEISDRRNDISEILSVFLNDRVVLCGYNCSYYDDIIINYILANYESLSNQPSFSSSAIIKGVSDSIMKELKEPGNQWLKYKHMEVFFSIDLMRMLFSEKNRVSLKECQVTMDYPNVVEYNKGFSVYVQEYEIEEVIKYCFNDAFSTLELLNRSEESVRLRESMIESMGWSCMNMDDSRLGMEVLKSRYMMATGKRWKELKDLRLDIDTVDCVDVLFDFIHFENNTLNDLMKQFKRKIINIKSSDPFRMQFYFDNLLHTLSMGGLHSKSVPCVIECNDDQVVVDLDVKSYYPSCIIKHHCGPRQLGEEFYPIYKQMISDRLDAKSLGDTSKAAILKYGINSVSGNMQSPYSFVYDPYQVVRMRLNGQFMLLMLIERLVKIGAKMYNNNTDGTIFLIDKCNIEKMNDASREWSSITGFDLDVDMFDRFYQYDISNYIGVRQGFDGDWSKVKRVGLFDDKLSIGKGMYPRVVSNALTEHFVNGVSIDDYIMQCDDIRQFLTYQKVGREFIVLHDNKPQQRINRYYMSVDGSKIYKAKQDEFMHMNNITCLNNDSGVTLLNTFDEKDIRERKINYRYYIGMTKDIAYQMKNRQLDMFDNMF